MKSKSTKILLSDLSQEMLRNQNSKSAKSCFEGSLILDPVSLFSELDWTQFEENAQVINLIYARVFEAAVIQQKQLIFFWPFENPNGGDWIELISLCHKNEVEVEIQMSPRSMNVDHGFGSEVLRAWKRFVYFLVESVLEDMHMNEQIEEVATLTGEQGSIVLFRMEMNGAVGYSFAVGEGYFGFPESNIGAIQDGIKDVPFFYSFTEMLEQLANANDLTHFKTKFMDRQLEKTYFHVLSKDFKTKNLIQYWLETYSLN